MRWLLFSCAVLSVFTCAGNLEVGPGGENTTDGGADAGAQLTGLPADGGLPCEVAELLGTHCLSCHGAPTAGGAPMPLLTRADLLATSPRDPGLTQAQRSLIRLRDVNAPMPPSGPPPAASVDAFAAWVQSGLPVGSCGEVDAGPPVLTCRSNTSLPRPTAANDRGDDDMAPGFACISCHSGQNFMGQNPGGALRNPDDVYQYMGTVFSAVHEQDLCAPRLGIAATVEILAADGGVVATLPVTAGGNFFGNANPRTSPFRARVVTAQGTREMSTLQTNGDCNTCHTAEGREGAPGRIFLP
jgi:hypothetical protein